ncbi:MAG: hypothetical protein KDC98_16800, partial [Planctomycetes bacterium]|nr:hypothetical protein [Planctomycetota bacterium]
MRFSSALAAAISVASPALAQRVPDLRVDHGSAAGASESWRPDIAVVGASIYTTWMDYRDGDMDIYFNRSRDGGRTWLANDVRLDTGSPAGSAWSADPRITASGDTVVVVWQDFRGGTFPHVAGIYCNRSLDGGATWLPADLRLDMSALPGANVALDPRICSVGNAIFVTWEDQRDGGRDVYF